MHREYNYFMKSSVKIDGVDFISSSRASEMTRYTKDYIGQLSRAGKIVSKKIGRVWYVSEPSLLDYKKLIDSSIIYQGTTVAKSSAPNSKKRPSRSYSFTALAIVVSFFISVSVYFISGSVWNIENIANISSSSSDATVLNGLVVVESATSTKRNMDTAAAVKNSFSDNVDVRVDPETNTGIITPRFDSATSSDYFYVMVPVDP